MIDFFEKLSQESWYYKDLSRTCLRRECHQYKGDEVEKATEEYAPDAQSFRTKGTKTVHILPTQSVIYVDNRTTYLSYYLLLPFVDFSSTSSYLSYVITALKLSLTPPLPASWR